MTQATRSSGQLVEVKDVKYLRDSKQLRIQNEVSLRKSQKKLEVIAGTRTRTSKTVVERYSVRRTDGIGPEP